MNVIGIDAGFLHTGVVAVTDGRIIDARTFNADNRADRMERVNAIVRKQTEAVRDFLDMYSRDFTVLIESPTNVDGTPWGPKSAMKGMSVSGSIYGVAVALGFTDVRLVAVKEWGAGERSNILAPQLDVNFGVVFSSKNEHEWDAAAMVKWFTG